MYLLRLLLTFRFWMRIRSDVSRLFLSLRVGRITFLYPVGELG